MAKMCGAADVATGYALSATVISSIISSAVSSAAISCAVSYAAVSYAPVPSAALAKQTSAIILSSARCFSLHRLSVALHPSQFYFKPKSRTQHVSFTSSSKTNASHLLPTGRLAAVRLTC